MTEQLSIRFHEELNDFLPADQRKLTFPCAIHHTRSIKDLVESLGVPHPEIDVITVNGECVDFTYLPRVKDLIEVYPASVVPVSLQLIHLKPEPLQESRFVLDCHLGRLAAYLRMIGFDTLYKNDYKDEKLADISSRNQRILLTCDRQLLMRNQVERGYFVRHRQPQLQLLEVIRRLNLFSQLKPFTRCMHCNGQIAPVDKAEIANRLLPHTRASQKTFWRCQQCNKIYWEGSHFERMKKLIDQLRARVEN